MDDLQRRFQRLDRITAPNLWNEAVGRAAELPMPRRWTFSPSMGLIAAGLLLAALAGSVAVGAWLNDRLSPEAEITTYENGMIAVSDGCHGLAAIDPVSFDSHSLLSTSDACANEFDLTVPIAWSREGGRLLYWGPAAIEPEQDGSLWLYEAETGTTRRLETCEGTCATFQADLSPDGSLVAYIGYAETDPGVATLHVRAVDSDELISVSLSGHPDGPLFSPDGRYVAVTLLGGRSGVYLIDVSRFDEGVISEPILIHGIVQASELAWSPDSEWLAMTQTGGMGHLIDDDRPGFNQQIDLSGQGIVIVSANGTQSRVLATLPTGSAEHWAWPKWSADSQSVAYVTTPVVYPGNGRGFELWTVSIDGGEPTRIYSTGCCTEHVPLVAWSPDGERLVFGRVAADNPADSGLFTIRPDGSDLRRISPDVLNLAWQPIPKE